MADMADRAPRNDTEAPQNTSRGLNPRAVQMVESALIGVLSLVGTIVLAPHLWWFPFAVFFVFDLSALGYLRSPATGADWYNAAHTYAWPALVGVIALVTVTFSPEWSLWFALVAFAWAFHVGFDRMLGYGLKLPDAFTHTHMGWIGKDRPATTPTR